MDKTTIKIDGIDTARGMALTGGTLATYRKVLTMFCKDAELRLQTLKYFLLESQNSKTGSFPSKHLASFSTQVHALKGASASLGATELPFMAERLEMAARDNELDFIQEFFIDFIDSLEALLKNIHGALDLFLDQEDEKDGALEANKDSSEYLSVFLELSNAIKSHKIADIDQMIEKIAIMPKDKKIDTILEKISDQVLMVEFDSAIKTIDEFSDELSGSTATGSA